MFLKTNTMSLTPLYALSLSHVQLFVTPSTIVHHAALSMGILQARIMEQVVMHSSRGSSQPRNLTQVSRIAGRYFTFWATSVLQKAVEVKIIFIMIHVIYIFTLLIFQWWYKSKWWSNGWLLLLSRFSSVRLCAPHRWQPTRLPHPWDSPGKNTGVGCHFLLQCMKVKSESEVAQSCPILSDPMECSPSGSSVYGIF